MKPSIVIAAVSALALSACGSNSEPTAADSEAAPAASAPDAALDTAAPAVAAAGTKPDAAFVVGKWATEGDCDVLGIEFKADGSMVGPYDRWELEDGILTMIGNPQKLHLTVIDAETMESRLDGTSDPDKLVRCP